MSELRDLGADDMNAPVLMWHGVSIDRRRPEDDPHSLYVTVDQLERQLDVLGRRPALSLDAWLVGGSRNGYLATFDDGYRSVLDLAAPVFAARSIPAVLFVPAGLAGRDGAPEPILDADGLRALQEHGFEIGVHGFDHVRLAGLDDSALRRQTVEAGERLADLTGRRPRAFSYPNGSFDDRAVAAVERAGYVVAFAVDRNGGRFAHPRIGIYGRDGVTVLRAKLLLSSPAFTPALGLLRRLRPSP